MRLDARTKEETTASVLSLYGRACRSLDIAVSGDDAVDIQRSLRNLANELEQLLALDEAPYPADTADRLRLIDRAITSLVMRARALPSSTLEL